MKNVAVILQPGVKKNLYILEFPVNYSGKE